MCKVSQNIRFVLCKTFLNSIHPFSFIAIVSIVFLISSVSSKTRIDDKYTYNNAGHVTTLSTSTKITSISETYEKVYVFSIKSRQSQENFVSQLRNTPFARKSLLFFTPHRSIYYIISNVLNIIKIILSSNLMTRINKEEGPSRRR